MADLPPPTGDPVKPRPSGPPASTTPPIIRPPLPPPPTSWWARQTNQAKTWMIVLPALTMVLIVGAALPAPEEEPAEKVKQSSKAAATPTKKDVPTPAETAAAKRASAKKAAAKKAKRQASFRAYFEQLVALSTTSDAIMTRYDDEVVPAVGRGDTLAAYEILEEMEAGQANVDSHLEKLQTPNGLSGKHSRMLSNASLDAQVAIDERKQALKDVRDYLNEGEIEKMSNAKGHLEQGARTWMAAITGAGLVGTELDVNIATMLPTE